MKNHQHDANTSTDHPQHERHEPTEMPELDAEMLSAVKGGCAACGQPNKKHFGQK